MLNRLLLILFVCLAISCNNGNTLINGVTLPLVELPNTEGTTIKLENLRGKIVLVDVWASWCKPCRKQNPKLVDIYKRYADADFETAEGFTIYGISLDTDKQAWLKAIDKDKLIWPHHVSELNGWKSKAVEAYQLAAIPASFLIDEHGIIIGTDLRFDEIEKILKKRLAQ